MIVVLVAAAAATVAGAVLALSTRDARVSLAGIAALILASPFVVDPPPGIVPLAGRVVGAILALELLRIAIREAAASPDGDGLTGVAAGPATARPALDVRVEALAAVAGIVAGIFVALRYAGAGVPLASGGPLILGAAFGLLAVGITPLLVSRDTLRLGTGAIVVLVGASLVGDVGAGVRSPLESLVASGLIVAVAAAVAAVMLNAMTASGALGFDDTLDVEAEREPVAATIMSSRTHTATGGDIGRPRAGRARRAHPTP